MVLEFFGTALSEDDLAQRCGTTLLGTQRVELARAAPGLGLAALLVDHLARDDVEACLSQRRPVIAWIDPSLLYPGVFGCTHAVVIVGLEPNSVVYHDPENGADVAVDWTHFQTAWDRRQGKGVILWKT